MFIFRNDFFKCELLNLKLEDFLVEISIFRLPRTISLGAHNAYEGGGADHPWVPKNDLRSLLIFRMVSSQLLANQNRLRASCYVWQAAQLCLTSNNSIFNNKYWAFTSTKSLFSKNLNMFIKFLIVHKQFVLKSLLLLRLRFFCFSKLHKFLNCTNLIRLPPIHKTK